MFGEGDRTLRGTYGRKGEGGTRRDGWSMLTERRSRTSTSDALSVGVNSGGRVDTEGVCILESAPLCAGLGDREARLGSDGESGNADARGDSNALAVKLEGLFGG